MTPSGLRLAVLLLAACCLARAAPAQDARPAILGVGPEERRQSVDGGEAPWRALGRLQWGGGRCTAFLTGPATVMSAAHCFYDHRLGAFVRPGSVHFLLGYDHGAYVAQATLTEYRIGPFDPKAGAESAGSDWAVATLSVPIGTPDRILPVARRAPILGQKVMLGGYGQDRMEVIFADTKCEVTGLADDIAGRLLLRHGCSGTRGTSGAPVMTLVDGRWTALGIEVRAPLGHPEGIAVALSGIDLATAHAPPYATAAGSGQVTPVPASPQ